MIKPTNEQINKFLRESNAIEREYDEIAFQDAKEAWKYAVENEKFDLDYIKRIHKRLMKRLNPRIAGKIREVPVYIGGERRDQSKEEIEKELRLLINIWHTKRFGKGESEIDFAKEWHIRFEAIHPFCDGNGRTGRILMNIQRLTLGQPLLIIHEGVEQHNYYKWFRKDRKEKIETFK